MEPGIYGFGVQFTPLPCDLFIDGGNGGRNGQLAIEVKSGRSGRLVPDAVATWFESMRGLQVGNSDYGLAILDPWNIYLRLPTFWTQKAPRRQLHEQGALIDYTYASEPSLAAFVDTNRLPLPKLRHEDMLLVVSSWLAFLMSASADQLCERAADAWTVETGLHRAIFGGSLQENKR